MALAENVHILTLEPWSDGTQLLRLEHVYDVGENPILYNPATIFRSTEHIEILYNVHNN